MPTQGVNKTSISVEGNFDIKGVLVKLTLSILAPVIVGKLLQFIPPVPKTVKKFKRWISIITSSCLAIMIWMNVRIRVAV